MSDRLFFDDIEFYQRLLSVAGIYDGKRDGKWTAAVDAADQEFSNQFAALAAQVGSFDQRSENAMRTLLPAAQRAARRFLAKAKTDFSQFTVRIISGTRTYAEQNALYRKGRFGNPGPIVTKAKGGQSNHNFGIAWDVGIFDGGKYLTGETAKESKIYKNLAAAAMSDELEWGGNWTSFVDMPHYQLKVPLELKKIREQFEAGKTFLA